VLAYGKRVRGEERTGEDYDNPDNDPRGPWASGNMVGIASKEARPNLHYDLINPKTHINYGCPDRGWRYERATMNTLIKDNRILWPASHEGRPREKVFLNDLSAQTNISSVIGQGIYTRDGTREVTEIFGKRVFDFPKPTGLLEELLLQGCPKDGIVLDSFAGSGTTAHATLALNKKDGGTRRFILVEFEDYANTITAERVKRVIEGYKFTGVAHEELMREPITFTTLRKIDKVLHDIVGIENLQAHRFDTIKKTVEDGVLIVTGEKEVKKRMDGLGGGFTYCLLGDSIEMDKLLSGQKLPSFEALGAVLFHTATNQAFVASKSYEKDGFGYLGESSAYHVWLIYKPDLEFLKSRDAALTLSRADAIAEKKKGKRHLVFAAAKFVSQRILNDRGLAVEFGPLPFALYRIDRS
jgi:adenine-specific DNA-methyltransferase